MWKQLRAAYAVDQVIFSPKKLEQRSFPTQKRSMSEALSSTKGERVFLIPGEGISLNDFKHPVDAVYIFGNAMQGNHSIVENSHVVHIPTPKPVDFFGITAAGIVLNDRERKRVN